MRDVPEAAAEQCPQHFCSQAMLSCYCPGLSGLLQWLLNLRQLQSFSYEHFISTDMGLGAKGMYSVEKEVANTEEVLPRLDCPSMCLNS